MNRFQWPVRVYYEDTDAGGVVYHANYLRFFERARTEFLRAAGYEQDVLRDEIGLLFAVRSVTVEFLKPALFNEALLVSVEPVDVRRASMSFAQTVARAGGDGAELCRARVRVACIDARRLRPAALPDELFRKLSGGA
jgi:acyl-CoA thioester hydrolase